MPNYPWMLADTEAPEAARFEEAEVGDEAEPGRAYDENGNVRPADDRYTDDPASGAVVTDAQDAATATEPAPTPPSTPAPVSTPTPEEKSAHTDDSEGVTTDKEDKGNG